MLTDLGVRFEWVDEGAVVDRLMVGEDYQLRVYAEDNRAGSLPGIALLFLDVDYNAALVNATSDPTISLPVTGQAGSNQRVAGGLRSAGGVNLFPGDEELLLFTTEFVALAPGALSLVSQVSLTPPSAFGDTTAITRSTPISFVGSSISVEGAGVRVTPTSGLVTTEAGGEASFQVSLSLQPTANVSVPIALGPGGSGEATLSTTALVFTPSTWNVPQSVTVRGVNDSVDDGDRQFLVSVGPATSSDSRFNALDAPDVSVTNRDDDAAALVVEPRTGLSVSESGTTTTVGVRLATQPVATVTVGIASLDPSEVSVEGAGVLTFTPANWNIVQTVTVRGVADMTVDGLQTAGVRLSVGAGSDAVYQPLAPIDLSVAIDDRDTPGFSVTRSMLGVSEAGISQSFGVMLDRRPAGPVVLRVTASDPTEAAIIVGGNLTFTPENWATAQAVTVAGVNDFIIDGLTTSTLTVAVDTAATDDPFDAAPPVMVTVATADDDFAALVVQPLESPLVLSETESQDAFSVRLSAQPQTEVMVSLVRESGDAATLNLTSLRFTPDNWNVPQVVAALGVADEVVEGPGSTVFRLAVVPNMSDPAFATTPSQTIQATTLDDDTATVAIARMTNGSEAGPAAGAFRVTLSRSVATETTVDYTVTGTATPGADYTALSGRVVIPAGVTEVMIPVAVLDDLQPELAETVVVTLIGVMSLPGVELDDSTDSASLLIEDNEAALVSVTPVAAGSEASATPVRFVVRQNLVTTVDTVVAFSLAGSASPADYQSAPASVTIPAGATEATLDLAVVNDAIAEGNETVLLRLVNILAGDNRLTLSASSSEASLAILDNDTAQVRVATFGSAREGGSSGGGFTFTQSNVSTSDSLIAFTIAGLAGEGDDFTALPRTVTIPAGQLSVPLPLSPLNDALVEPSESVALTITGVTSANGRSTILGGGESATLAIADDDTATLRIARQSDGDEAGASQASFRFTLSAPSATDTLVRYTLGGSATPGVDYVANSGVAVIAAGQTSIDVVLAAIDDSMAEGPESVVVMVTGVEGLSAVTLDPQNAATTLLIADNERPRVFVSGASMAVEGAGAQVRFTVTQEVASSTNTVVRFALSGLATEGTDYTAPVIESSRLLTIPAGMTSVAFDLTLIDDSIVEADEAVQFSLVEIVSGDTALLFDVARATAATTIEDNDSATVGVVVTPAANETSTNLALVFALSAASATDTRVEFSLSGIATEGVDYAALPRSVTIPAGQFEAVVPILLIADGLVEPAETLQVTVNSIAAASERVTIDSARATGVLTVTNVDRASVRVERVADGSEQGPSAGQFRVALSAPSSSATEVLFTLSGSATAGADYAPTSGRVTIPAGQTAASVTLATLEDTVVEGSETVLITLDSILTGAQDGDLVIDAAARSAMLTLLDNESPLVFIESSSNGAEAGQAPGAFIIAQNLVAPTDTLLTVAFGGTATAGADYSSPSLTVTIPAGAMSVSVPIAVIDDASDEANESVTLTIEALVAADPRIAIDSTRAQSSLTITDNDTAGVVVRSLSGTRLTEGGASGTLEVALGSRPASPVTVSLTSSDATEINLSASTVIFTPDNWDTPRQVSATGVDDDLVDGDRVVRFEAASSSDDEAYDTLAPTSIELIHGDNDRATIGALASMLRVVEGTGDGVTRVTFDVTLDLAVEGGFSIAYAASPESAGAADFATAAGSIAFTGVAGETRAVVVDVVRDNVVEADESFRFTLGAVAGDIGGRIDVEVAPISVVIEDDDTATIRLAPASAPEGSPGAASQLRFLATLDRPVQGGFRIATSAEGVTATRGDDFLDPAGSLLFLGMAGETMTLIVPVVADRIVEGNESLRAALGAISGLGSGIDPGALTVAVATAEGTIVDDDTASIAFVAGSSSVNEVAGTHTVTVRLTAPAGVTLGETVSLRVVDVATGSASLADYGFGVQTVEFPAGSGDGTTRVVTLTLTSDTLLEANETVALRLELGDDGIGGAVTLGATTQHNVTIVDDPRTASISGSVWVDANGDGVRQTTEAPLAGVEVNLGGTDSEGTMVSRNTRTSSQGVYRFEGLTAGLYEVSFVSPQGFIDGADLLGTVNGRGVGVVAPNRLQAIALPPAGAGAGYNFASRGLVPSGLHAGTFTATRLASTAAPATAVAASAPALAPARLLAAPATASLTTPPAAPALVTARPASKSENTATDEAFAQLGRRWRFASAR